MGVEWNFDAYIFQRLKNGLWLYVGKVLKKVSVLDSKGRVPPSLGLQDCAPTRVPKTIESWFNPEGF